MTDATDYDPVECPVSDCTYRDAIRPVAAHVGRSDDEGHEWDRLGYGGARDFVETEKRRQRQAGGQASAATTTDSSSTNAASTTSTATTSETADESEATDEPEPPFELGFEREALVLLKLVSEYDLSSLDALGTGQLADLYSLLADLKNSAEDARKEVRDALLDELHEDGTLSADLGSVERRTYEYRRTRDESDVRRALVDAGVNPESVRSFDEGKLRDAIEETDLDEDAVFDVDERAQIRISDSNDDRRREQFERLDAEIRSLVEDDG
ncbi:hypothetical protein [Halorussus salinisoli]|uniref:hypothetical protein n=1 Tax=Halorussus salinisoli TaxID=2558242 RepID=UPI0010C1ABBE|nr:hypothetical protein [Halorussus salinisoli]